MTGKQTCFAKTPRELFNSYAYTIILVEKFAAGLCSFGYVCFKIVGSLLNPEKKSVQ